MKTTPNISDAEWLVMKVLWAKSPGTTVDVVETLEPTTKWKLKTVLTLLNRLVKKGALGFDKKGRAYHYYPLVEEAACVRAETRSFLERVHSGSLKPMLAEFLGEAELSKAEIEDLRSFSQASAVGWRGHRGRRACSLPWFWRRRRSCAANWRHAGVTPSGSW
jgi:BlaI family penicillinase repressor